MHLPNYLLINQSDNIPRPLHIKGLFKSNHRLDNTADGRWKMEKRSEGEMS